MTLSLRSEKGGRLLALASAGILSGLLYLTFVLSFAFLVPVQYAFARRSPKEGMIAAAISFAVIAAGQAYRLAKMGAWDFSYVAAGLVPPVALLAAIAAINARWGKIGTGARILIVAALLSAAAAPFLSGALSDGGFSSTVTATAKELLVTSSDMTPEQADAIARTSVEAAKSVLMNAFALMILSIVAASWWMGSRIAQPRKRVEEPAEAGGGREGRAGVPELSTLKISHALLWPGLASWAILLATILVGMRGLGAAIAWNLALCLAACYAAQGLAIVSHFTKKWNLPPALRVGIALLAMVGLLNPATGVPLAIALPLLGITEVWIPYRTLKGART